MYIILRKFAIFIIFHSVKSGCCDDKIGQVNLVDIIFRILVIGCSHVYIHLSKILSSCLFIFHFTTHENYKDSYETFNRQVKKIVAESEFDQRNEKNQGGYIYLEEIRQQLGKVESAIVLVSR